MNKNKNYRELSYSNLVTRRDFGKIEANFQEPDLREMQNKSYKDFLDHKLEELIRDFFPISHSKSEYEVRVKNTGKVITLAEPLFS